MLLSVTDFIPFINMHHKLVFRIWIGLSDSFLGKQSSGAVFWEKIYVLKQEMILQDCCSVLVVLWLIVNYILYLRDRKSIMILL